MKMVDPLVKILRYLDKRDNFVSEPEIEVDAREFQQLVAEVLRE